MRRASLGGLFLLAAMALGTAWVGSAGATQRTAARSAADTVEVKFPAPAVGKAAVELVTVRATAPSGKRLGPLSVRVANAAKLGAGFGAVAAVQAPRKLGTTATFRIYVVMYMGNRKNAPRAPAAARSGQGIDVVMDVVFPNGETRHQTVLKDNSTSCTMPGPDGGLAGLNKWFESGPTYRTTSGLPMTYTLQTVLKMDSEPESFLDSIVGFLWGNCPGTPEAPDAGAA